MSHNKVLSIELAVKTNILRNKYDHLKNAYKFSYTKGFNSHKELSFERSYTRVLSRLADFQVYTNPHSLTNSNTTILYNNIVDQSVTLFSWPAYMCLYRRTFIRYLMQIKARFQMDDFPSSPTL